MSVTRSIQFYCGKRNVKTKSFFGGYYMQYEFCKDIAYKDIDFSFAAKELRSYMQSHDIKIGYCDIAYDLGAGFSLFKRYTFVNKGGKIITQKERYDS